MNKALTEIIPAIDEDRNIFCFLQRLDQLDTR